MSYLNFVSLSSDLPWQSTSTGCRCQSRASVGARWDKRGHEESRIFFKKPHTRFFCKRKFCNHQSHNSRMIKLMKSKPEPCYHCLSFSPSRCSEPLKGSWLDLILRLDSYGFVIVRRPLWREGRPQKFFLVNCVFCNACSLHVYITYDLFGVEIFRQCQPYIFWSQCLQFDICMQYMVIAFSLHRHIGYTCTQYVKGHCQSRLCTVDCTIHHTYCYNRGQTVRPHGLYRKHRGNWKEESNKNIKP
jgi:hypothetical protein